MGTLKIRFSHLSRAFTTAFGSFSVHQLPLTISDKQVQGKGCSHWVTLSQVK